MASKVTLALSRQPRKERDVVIELHKEEVSTRKGVQHFCPRSSGCNLEIWHHFCHEDASQLVLPVGPYLMLLHPSLRGQSRGEGSLCTPFCALLPPGLGQLGVYPKFHNVPVEIAPSASGFSPLPPLTRPRQPPGRLTQKRTFLLY